MGVGGLKSSSSQRLSYPSGSGRGDRARHPPGREGDKWPAAVRWELWPGLAVLQEKVPPLHSPHLALKRKEAGSARLQHAPEGQRTSRPTLLAGAARAKCIWPKGPLPTPLTPAAKGGPSTTQPRQIPGGAVVTVRTPAVRPPGGDSELHLDPRGLTTVRCVANQTRKYLP